MVGVSAPFVSTNLGKHEKAPAGKAVRARIIEIAEYLKCPLVKVENNECMQGYDAKKSRRKQKTKKWTKRRRSFILKST